MLPLSVGSCSVRQGGLRELYDEITVNDDNDIDDNYEDDEYLYKYHCGGSRGSLTVISTRVKLDK